MRRTTCLPHSAFLFAAAVLLLGATAPVGADGRTVIHAGSLVDVEAGEVLGRHTIVVVEGETIMAVEEGARRSGGRRHPDRPLRPHRSARLDGHARSPDFAAGRRRVLSRTVPADSGGRHGQGADLREAHAARRLHHRPRRGRRDDGDPRGAECDQPRRNARASHLRRDHLACHDRRPRRPDERHEAGPPGRPRPQAGHRQRHRGRPQGGPAALQGGRRPHQDHRHGRRPEPGQERSEPAVHGGGDPGDRRHGERLRLHGRRPRARGRGHEAGDPRRRDDDRTRHLHGRRGVRADEGARHLVRPHHLGGQLRGREGGGARLLPRDHPAQGGRHRAGHPGHLRQGPSSRRADRLRHGLRRLPPRQQRPGVPLHGRRGAWRR